MSDDLSKPIPIGNIHQEDGAHELASLPDMEPYLKFAMAVVRDADTSAALAAISRLPLERRYVWRVASALKWAFADCDDLSVEADRQTLVPEDLAKLTELLKHRPVQFCLFLKALLGPQELERIMAEALGHALQAP